MLFAKFSLNPYVGREGVSLMQTQHHQLQSREEFPVREGEARTSGKALTDFPAPHIELQQWDFSCRLPSPGVAEIAILPASWGCFDKQGLKVMAFN